MNFMNAFFERKEIEAEIKVLMEKELQFSEDLRKHTDIKFYITIVSQSLYYLVYGVLLRLQKRYVTDETMSKWIEKRNVYRQENKFIESDLVREFLIDMGVELKDNKI